MAARLASGTFFARGAANKITSSSVNAWTMPAIGVLPPLCTFVTVLAIVPVAGMPPKNGLTKLAMPCAINSWLGWWRSWIMPSATLAQSSDSIEPSKARVRAGMMTNCAVSQLTGIHWKWGRPEGIPPKRLPIVSTGRFITDVMIVASTIATTVPGKWLNQPRWFWNFLQMISKHRLPVAKASAIRFTVSAAP